MSTARLSIDSGTAYSTSNQGSFSAAAGPEGIRNLNDTDRTAVVEEVLKASAPANSEYVMIGGKTNTQAATKGGGCESCGGCDGCGVKKIVEKEGINLSKVNQNDKDTASAMQKGLSDLGLAIPSLASGSDPAAFLSSLNSIVVGSTSAIGSFTSTSVSLVEKSAAATNTQSTNTSATSAASSPSDSRVVQESSGRISEKMAAETRSEKIVTGKSVERFQPIEKTAERLSVQEVIASEKRESNQLKAPLKTEPVAVLKREASSRPVGSALASAQLLGLKAPGQVRTNAAKPVANSAAPISTKLLPSRPASFSPSGVISIAARVTSPSREVSAAVQSRNELNALRPVSAVAKMSVALNRAIARLEANPSLSTREVSIKALHAITIAKRLDRTPAVLKSALDANAKQIVGLREALRMAKGQSALYKEIRATLLQTLKRTSALLARVARANNSVAVRIPRGLRVRVLSPQDRAVRKLAAPKTGSVTTGSVTTGSVKTGSVKTGAAQQRDERSGQTRVFVASKLKTGVEILRGTVRTLVTRLRTIVTPKSIRSVPAKSAVKVQDVRLNAAASKIRPRHSDGRHVEGFVAPFAPARSRIKSRTSDRYATAGRLQTKKRKKGLAWQDEVAIEDGSQELTAKALSLLSSGGGNEISAKNNRVIAASNGLITGALTKEPAQKMFVSSGNDGPRTNLVTELTKESEDDWRSFYDVAKSAQSDQNSRA